MKILSALVLTLCLAGCVTPGPDISAPVVVRTRQIGTRIPVLDLECGGGPSGHGITTDDQGADYIIGLRAALRDCRNKLGVVRRVIGKRN